MILSFYLFIEFKGFPGGSVSKESASNAGDSGLFLGLGRSRGERNGSLLHYSCLEDPMYRGAWQHTVCRVTRVGHDLATKPPPTEFNATFAVS